MPLVFGRSIFGFAVVAGPPAPTWTDPDIANASYDSVSFSVATQDTVPRTATFKDDGTKMYMLGQTGDKIYQYSLSTAWDLSTASYDSVTFDISTQTGLPSELWWSTNGDYFYIVDILSPVTFQYNLTTAWDLSTASYANKSFNFSTQEGAPLIIGFKSDGTKVYIGGNVNDTLYQYSLSTAWDISTASYDSKSLSYSSQIGNAQGLFISPNGDKVWIVGAFNENTVYEYGLTTPWDMSTGSYSSISKTLSQDNNIQSLFFKSDGSKLYAMGGQNDTIFQYSTVASVWTDPDLANASYDSITLPSTGVLQGDTNPYGLTFKDDGTEVYYCGVSFDQIASYTLSTAWDLSTATYNTAYSVGSNPRDIHFNSDGTKMFTFHTQGNLIRRHDLTTGWDISTASLNSNSYTPTVNGQIRGGFLNSDGTRMWISDLGNFRSYNLSTGFDLSTASVDATATSKTNQYGGGLHFNPSGTKIFVIFGNNITSFSLSTAYDISTASEDSDFLATGTEDTGMNGVAFKSDGSKAYTIGLTNDKIYQYSTVAPAWTNPNLATASYDSVSFSVTSQDTSPFGLTFKDDGTKFYMSGNDNNTVYQYAVSTAWDISTASFETGKTLIVTSEEITPHAVMFKSDGTSVYVMGLQGDSIFQYDLTTAWDISTASYASKSLSVSTQETSPRAFYFKDDGSKVYVVGTANDTVYQYALSTAWDVSTGSFETGKSFSVASQSTTPTGLFLSPNGDKMYVLNFNTQAYQYSLSTAWDVSTASYDSVSFNGSSQDGFGNDIYFKSDGSKMYITGATNDTVYQYST